MVPSMYRCPTFTTTHTNSTTHRHTVLNPTTSSPSFPLPSTVHRVDGFGLGTLLETKQISKMVSSYVGALLAFAA